MVSLASGGAALADDPVPSTIVLDDEQSVAEESAAKTKVNVLIVDDQPANLLVLEAMLGDLDINLIHAGSGFEALQAVLKNDFAVILMDVKMPGMDGFEAAELIHHRKRSKHIPIIFLTGVETADAQMFKGYALGAVDYLMKPLTPAVLRSKVAVFVDIYRKTEQIKRQAELLRQLEQREHERQLAAAKARWETERLYEEIRIAREVQQKLFPAAPLPLAGIDLAGASFPAEATGGDYFDYIPMQDGSLAVVIGDVSGHGFGPALLMAELRAYLRAFLLTRTNVGEIVGLLNRALAADTDDRFATLFLGKIDTRERTLVYSSAGHLPGYLFSPDGQVKALLKNTGMPLGIVPDGTYQASPPCKLESGELILLLTDGIMEAHGPEEKLFGMDRILAVVRENLARPAREILNLLYNAVHEFRGPKGQSDDMTAIILKAE